MSSLHYIINPFVLVLEFEHILWLCSDTPVCLFIISLYHFPPSKQSSAAGVLERPRHFRPLTPASRVLSSVAGWMPESGHRSPAEIGSDAPQMVLLMVVMISSYVERARMFLGLSGVRCTLYHVYTRESSFFLATPSSLWDPNPLTRGRTSAPFSRSVEP